MINITEEFAPDTSTVVQWNGVFTSGEIATLAGVSLDEVDYWVRSHLITPSIRPASGQGSRRLFSRDDLRNALLVHRLWAVGWKPKQISSALAVIGKVLRDPDGLSTPLLVHEGKALLILCRDPQRGPVLLDAASPGQQVMVIALETLEEETRLSLARNK